MKGQTLSKKQFDFAKEYAKTGNGTQSALKVYDTEDPNTANQIAVDNLRKPIVIKAIKSIAEQIPDSLLVKVHKEGLKSVDNEGNTDYNARHKYLDTAYKLKKLYEDNGGGNKTLIINVSEESANRFGLLSNHALDNVKKELGNNQETKDAKIVTNKKHGK